MHSYSIQEFRRIWEEMDKIEPLTPITTTTTEENDATSDGTSPDIYTSTT